MVAQCFPVLSKMDFVHFNKVDVFHKSFTVKRLFAHADSKYAQTPRVFLMRLLLSLKCPGRRGS